MFDELKNSWKNQKANNLPGVNELLREVKQSRSKLSLKLLTGVVGLLFAIVVFVMIMYLIPFKYAMTQYSILAMGFCMFVAVVYLLYMRNQIPTVSDTSKDSKLYVQQWINYRKNVAAGSKRFMITYFLIIMVGMAIYLYEITEDNIVLMIVAYSSVFLWFAACWFILKPKWEKSTDQKVQAIIDNYQSIADQLKA